MDNGASRETGTTDGIDFAAYPSRVATAIRDAFEASGLALNAFATQTGIPRTTLRRYIEGHDDPKFGQVARIAEVLGVPLKSLAWPYEDAAA